MLEFEPSPGWLRRDTSKAAAQLLSWADARDERMVQMPNEDLSIKNPAQLYLAGRDWKTFVEALKNPPKAVLELKKLLAEQK